MKKAAAFMAIAMLSVCLFTGCRWGCAHAYQSEIIQAATCTQVGKEKFTCVRCGDSYTQLVAMPEHTYETAVVTKDATCEAEGQITYTCTVCAGVKNVTVDKLAHTVAQETFRKEPNCTENGVSVGTCTVCGEENAAVTIPVNGEHVFENTVIRAATCTDPGEGVDTCSLCGYSQACTYAYKEHAFNPIQTVAATCTTDGTQKAVCAVCGVVEDRNISATGHKWEGATCTKEGTCSVCGVVGSKADHQYETIWEEKGDGQFYADWIKKQCITCGDNKELCYAGTPALGGPYEFDIGAIRQELEAYAQSYGFQVSNAFSEIDFMLSQIETHKLHVFQVYYGPAYGPDSLLAQGKQMIDRERSRLEGTSQSPSAYTFYLSVFYNRWEGGGSFNLWVTMRKTETE